MHNLVTRRPRSVLPRCQEVPSRHVAFCHVIWQTVTQQLRQPSAAIMIERVDTQAVIPYRRIFLLQPMGGCVQLWSGSRAANSDGNETQTHRRKSTKFGYTYSREFKNMISKHPPQLNVGWIQDKHFGYCSTSRT